MDIKRLKALREQQNISQKQLAEHLEISPQRYNYYETGKREPDNDMLVKLAKYFNVSVDYLLGFSEIQERISSSIANAKVSEEIEILKDYEKLPQADKDIIKYIIKRRKTD